jgi:hypothetical protein
MHMIKVYCYANHCATSYDSIIHGKNQKLFLEYVYSLSYTTNNSEEE